MDKIARASQKDRACRGVESHCPCQLLLLVLLEACHVGWHRIRCVCVEGHLLVGTWSGISVTRFHLSPKPETLNPNRVNRSRNAV